jgi:hypothetical protein
MSTPASAQDSGVRVVTTTSRPGNSGKNARLLGFIEPSGSNGIAAS